jgi:hypothetical protein
MEYIHAEIGGASSELVEGQFTYLGVVTLVNSKVLTSTSNYNFWTFFFTMSQTLAFIFFFWILNLRKDYALFGLFQEVFGHLNAYVAIAFMSGAMVLVDNGLHLAQYEIKKLVELKEKEKQRKIKQQMM